MKIYLIFRCFFDFRYKRGKIHDYVCLQKSNFNMSKSDHGDVLFPVIPVLQLETLFLKIKKICPSNLGFLFSNCSHLLEVRQINLWCPQFTILPKNQLWDNLQYIKLSQRLFFGRIEDTINCFRDLMTFNHTRQTQPISK